MKKKIALSISGVVAFNPTETLLVHVGEGERVILLMDGRIELGPRFPAGNYMVNAGEFANTGKSIPFPFAFVVVPAGEAAEWRRMTPANLSMILARIVGRVKLQEAGPFAAASQTRH